MCPYHEKIGAYYDGEVDDLTRIEIARHLVQCSECQAEMAALSSMSVMFATAEEPRLSQISLHRLHRRLDVLRDQSLIRAARAMCAVAACVLVVASVWLMKAGNVQTSQVSQPSVASNVATPPWADVVVASSTDVDSQNFSSPAAAWYLAPVAASDDSQQR